MVRARAQAQPARRGATLSLRTVRAFACALACALALAGALGAPLAASAVPAPTASPASPSHSVDTVVVLLTPFLTWDDVLSLQARNLNTLAGLGAIGNMNSDTADWGWPTAAGGALSLSASRWAAAPVGASATATDIAAIRAANAASLDAPDIGALGAVLHAAGLRTAAVGNADEETASPSGMNRPAELVAMDRNGRVEDLATGRSLLATDPAAPFGVHANVDLLDAAVRRALALHPALLVLDPGDLERAHDASPSSSLRAARYHAAAVTRADWIAGRLLGMLSTSRALLLVVTPATDKPYYQRPYFGPTIAVGPGFAGDLTSASTQQRGLVANVDVAPTILSALGLEATATMAGQPMTALAAPMTGGTPPSLADRIVALRRLGESVGAVDYVRDLYFIPLFCWIAIAIVALAALVALAPALGALRPAARGLVLAVLCVPSGAWLLFALNRYPTSPGQVTATFAAATVGVFALVLGLSAVMKSRAEVIALALATLTSLLICADQWTGHPFETGLFSYSVRAGWRYYGMGNEGAALLVGAVILATGLTCDLLAETRWAHLARVALAPSVGAIAIVTIAAPFAGANAGAAVWGVVAFGVAWARINGMRLTWRTAGSVAGAVVVLVAALVAIDVLRGGAETHLGRFFADFATGNFSAAGDLVTRKALNSYAYSQQTPYTWLAIAIAVALAATEWGGARPLARALAARPGLASALVGVLVGGVAAMLTEDSGTVMPALMLLAGALPVLFLALAKPVGRSS